MFHVLTVASFEPFLTFTLVLVRLCVGARSSILTWLMGTAIVQIFVTQESTPVDVTYTLPRLGAGPIHAARKRQALVTQWAHPAVMTLAFSGFVTEAVELVTALLTHSIFALKASPAIHANLGAIRVAFEVAKKVVS